VVHVGVVRGGDTMCVLGECFGVLPCDVVGGI
jgi:hypothetical protein